jgi:queuine tRNA-ribosyltransferase
VTATHANIPAAYLRHLAGEILGPHLATVHNLRFMQRLMTEIREHIGSGTFPGYRERFLEAYQVPDQDVRHAQRAARRQRARA